MTTEEALMLFRMKAPTTLNAVKSRYRFLSQLEHPDKSKHPQAVDRFARVSDAYAVLRADLSILEDTDGVFETETGDKLSELGKGLGPTTNGSTCGDCDGKGYRIVTGHNFRNCTNCKPQGFFDRFVELKCWKCLGSGSFVRDGKTVGKCFTCSGSGWTKVDVARYAAKYHEHPCRVCGGTRVSTVPAKKLAYTCERCKGLGELAMWNPALVKGLLISAG